MFDWRILSFAVIALMPDGGMVRLARWRDDGRIGLAFLAGYGSVEASVS
jgi:hypothetical protein